MKKFCSYRELVMGGGSKEMVRDHADPKEVEGNPLESGTGRPLIYYSFGHPDLQGNRASLFFWRDHTGNEVDLLAGDDTNLTGVEIKSGSTVASDWARGLAFFQKVSGPALAHTEILHGGGNSLPCGIARAVPWTRLAEKKSFASL